MSAGRRTTRWVVKAGSMYLGLVRRGHHWGWTRISDGAFVFGHVHQARVVARAYGAKVYRLVGTGRPRMTMREKWGGL